MLSLFEVALDIKLFSQMAMGILQQVFSELGHKSDHVVVLLGLSVDVDGKIRFVGSKVHSLGVLIITLVFEFSCFLNVKHSVLRLWKVSRDYLVGLIPLVGSDIHLESFNKLSCVDIVLLSEIELSNLGIVLGDLLVVWSSNFRWLIGYKLNSSVPLSSVKSCLNGLVEDASLDIVLDGKIKLLLADKVVTPLFLKLDNMSWE
jgi:hypothetical protein